MSEDFDRESRALRAALEGEPVNWSDVAANYDLDRAESPSANHKLGCNPAWGLDALRRGDHGTVADVLSWASFYADQPLHENEALTPNVAYRPRIATGTYALAVLAHKRGREELAERLLERIRADIAWMLLGAFTGPAKRFDAESPRGPRELVADGPLLPVPGSGGAVPYVAQAGLRGHHWVDGKWMMLNDAGLSVLVAQALGLPYSGTAFENAHSIFFHLRRLAPELPRWGFSVVDAGAARAYLKAPWDVTFAREVARWINGAPLPLLPVSAVRRESGAIEFAMLSTHDSSTGARVVEVVEADGTRRIGSSDNGLRGVGEDRRRNIQPQFVLELPEEWLTSWKSGDGVKVRVRRPPASDPEAWRLTTDGASGLSFSVPQPPLPAPEPPRPPKPPKPSKGGFWKGIMWGD